MKHYMLLFINLFNKISIPFYLSTYLFLIKETENSHNVLIISPAYTSKGIQFETKQASSNQ